jgi:hypothetical protein
VDICPWVVLDDEAACAGTRWLHYTQSCFKYCEDPYSEDVDWRTGEAHKIVTSLRRCTRTLTPER